MLILDPRTGLYVEIATPPRAPTARLEERQETKAARIQKKAERRAAAWTALRQAELDSGVL